MTHVAYLKLIVAGARRMWLKTEAMVPPTSLPPWSPGMSDARSCRRERIKHYLSVRNVRCL